MKLVLIALAAALFGALAAPALAHHPDEASTDPTPAVERVLGPDTTATENGLLKVPLADGSALRTHGPDVAPDATEAFGFTAEGPSERLLPGSPERAPICATDYAMQVLYARAPASPDRLESVAPELRSVVRRSNSVLNEEAIASGGGGGDYKVVCDGEGAVDVKGFATTTGTSFSATVSAAKAAGFNNPTRNYTIFIDEPAPGGYCGVGSLYIADSPGLSNPHNANGGYAVIYEGCWEGVTFMHEVGHNRGAVQENAPGSTGDGNHCNQGYDVMCYAPDGGDRNQTMVFPCPSLTRFDCGFDTYFDAAPEPGEWLSDHWNLGAPGQNFLAIVPASQGDEEPPEQEDVTPPETTIMSTPSSPTSLRSATFSFGGSDETSAAGSLRFECSLDGSPYATCVSPKKYARLARVRHAFSVRAVDEAGNADATPATFSWRIRRFAR